MNTNNQIKKITAITLLKRVIVKINMNGGDYTRLQKASTAVLLIESGIIKGYEYVPLQDIGLWVESLIN